MMTTVLTLSTIGNFAQILQLVLFKYHKEEWSAFFGSFTGLILASFTVLCCT